MNKQKRDLYIQALESPYEKAIRLKCKLAKSKTHSVKVTHTVIARYNPELLCSMYPRTFIISNGYVKFNN